MRRLSACGTNIGDIRVVGSRDVQSSDGVGMQRRKCQRLMGIDGKRSTVAPSVRAVVQ